MPLRLWVPQYPERHDRQLRDKICNLCLTYSKWMLCNRSIFSLSSRDLKDSSWPHGALQTRVLLYAALCTVNDMAKSRTHALVMWLSREPPHGTCSAAAASVRSRSFSARFETIAASLASLASNAALTSSDAAYTQHTCTTPYTTPYRQSAVFSSQT